MAGKTLLFRSSILSTCTRSWRLHCSPIPCKRNSFLPLPIPIPIPVKVGGNTIIALPSEDGGTTYIPLRGGSSNNCYQPPCYNMGNSYKRRGFW
ncbi:hypothetical protein CEXT_641411 [Caerostris extrusa]|uniref:Uncharacterized protein n=1 Tax=Caerostris extrusa TaxID=172846 RepID=A0AAV4QUK7_CAEEX|nr:hypothetical protein CEXT_641411 [Caerostris extrusa]